MKIMLVDREMARAGGGTWCKMRSGNASNTVQRSNCSRASDGGRREPVAYLDQKRTTVWRFSTPRGGPIHGCRVLREILFFEIEALLIQARETILMTQESWSRMRMHRIRFPHKPGFDLQATS